MIKKPIVIEFFRDRTEVPTGPLVPGVRVPSRKPLKQNLKRYKPLKDGDIVSFERVGNDKKKTRSFPPMNAL